MAQSEARRLRGCWSPGVFRRFSTLHLGVKHLSPFKKSFSPDRRHCRHTGPVYLAILSLYVLRRLGGRHPLCGMGVTSLILVTVSPAP